MKAEDDPGFFAPFFVGDFFFVVGLANKCEGCAVDSCTGFDDMGNKLFFCFLIEIFQRLAAGFLVLFQVVIGAVGDSLEFLGAEGERVEEVIGALGVESAIFLGNIENRYFIPRNADRFVPRQAILQPLIEPFFAFRWANKEFDLHLFEFTGAKGKISGVDFVSKGFSDLGDSKRKFFARDLEDVFELDEHGLGGFGAEVGKVSLVLYGADVGFEHQVKLAGFGQLPATGVDHFAGFLGAGCGGDLIGTEAALAGFAVDHGIGESGLVSTGFPYGATHEDGAIHPDDIVPVLGHTFPPVILQISFQGSPQGAVIPSTVEAAVDFGRREDKASAFTESDDLFHAVIRHRSIFGF